MLEEKAVEETVGAPDCSALGHGEEAVPLPGVALRGAPPPRDSGTGGTPGFGVAAPLAFAAALTGGALASEKTYLSYLDRSRHLDPRPCAKERSEKHCSDWLPC